MSEAGRPPPSPRAAPAAFYGSLFFSRLADQMLLFLVPLVVFQASGKATWAGIAFFVEALPRFVAFPIFGALSDRLSPVRVLRASQSSRALACLAGIAGYLLWGGIGWLVALSAVCGVFTSQGMVAREVLLPRAFRTHRFEKVLSHTQIADQLGVVLGPLLAAALLGWKNWQNWEWAVGIAALLFLLADGLTVLWQRRSALALPPLGRGGGHWYEPLRVAAGHVVRLPGLARLVLLAAAENLVIGVTLASSAAMVTGTFGQTQNFFAALQVAGAVATVLILAGVARVPVPRRLLGLVAFLAILAGGVATAAGHSIWLYVAGFLLVTGFDKMFNIYIRSARQAIIPPEDLGKTTGLVVMLNNLTQPLAGLLVGLFAGQGRLGLVILLVSAAMALLGAAALTMRVGLAHRPAPAAQALRS